MKKLFFILIFFFSEAKSQQTKLLRHNLGVGFITTNLSKSEKSFLILNSSYEFRTKKLNNKLGIGVNYTFVKSGIQQTEFAIGPRINYHLLVGDKIDPYFGIGGVLSKWKYVGKQESNFQFKYQLGLKYSILYHLDIFIELSNYRYNGGVYQSSGTKTKSGVFPTFGISIK